MNAWYGPDLRFARNLGRHLASLSVTFVSAFASVHVCKITFNVNRSSLLDDTKPADEVISEVVYGLCISKHAMITSVLMLLMGLELAAQFDPLNNFVV